MWWQYEAVLIALKNTQMSIEEKKEKGSRELSDSRIHVYLVVNWLAVHLHSREINMNLTKHEITSASTENWQPYFTGQRTNKINV